MKIVKEFKENKISEIKPESIKKLLKLIQDENFDKEK